MQYNYYDNYDKSAFKYGKINNYDGLTGEIVSEDNIYYFNKNDLLNFEEIKNNDFVRFNSKTEDYFPQAYYITKQLIYKSK